MLITTWDIIFCVRHLIWNTQNLIVTVIDKFIQLDDKLNSKMDSSEIEMKKG